MDSTPLSSLPPLSHPSAPPSPKLLRACQDFEAVLLGSLLRSLEETFSSVPGGEPESAGNSDYHYLAVQSFASALSRAGGLGLASRIAQQLGRT